MSIETRPDAPAGGDLHGRVALVTGVSRDVGIGAAIARRLHAEGATVVASGWPPHDDEMPWGSTAAPDVPVPIERDDLAEPEAPATLVDRVVDRHGRIDIIVATHARSSSHDLAASDAGELDTCWAVNVRSVVLLAQRLAARHEPAPPDGPPLGRMLWFTSGQHHGPMDGELPYAITKGALHQMAATMAAALAPQRIAANCINPGPVDTGYASPDVLAAVAHRFPDQRWGVPDDIAAVVAFLVGDDGAWIRGQVLDVDGGFRYAG